MTKLLPANRVAAILTWASGLGALILGIVHTFPASWQNVALVVAGLLTKASVAVKFLEGSQRWEHTLIAYAEASTPPESVIANEALQYPTTPAPPATPSTPGA